MRTLSKDELAGLEEEVLYRLWDALVAANTRGELGLVLNTLGMSDLADIYLRDPGALFTFPEGKILVIGAPQSMEKELKGVAKKMGITPKRIEFVRYEQTTNYNFDELEYDYHYCAILFGPSPHSAKGKGDESSILTHIEGHRDRFAECRRLLTSNGFGVTKTNYMQTLSDLMDEGLVMAA